MRCIACNRALSEFESTRKSSVTGKYLDLCNNCYSEIAKDIHADERDDLRYEADNVEDSDYDEADLNEE